MSNPNLDPNKDQLSTTEQEIEKALRPQGFEEFTGQAAILLAQPYRLLTI